MDEFSSLVNWEVSFPFPSYLTLRKIPRHIKGIFKNAKYKMERRMIFAIIQVIEKLFGRKFFSFHLPLVPLYILSVFSTILVICFISFFHCEYRRQRKDKVEQITTATLPPADSEST